MLRFSFREVLTKMRSFRSSPRSAAIGPRDNYSANTTSTTTHFPASVSDENGIVTVRVFLLGKIESATLCPVAQSGVEKTVRKPPPRFPQAARCGPRTAGSIDRTLASVYYRFPKLISNSHGDGAGRVERGRMSVASAIGVATRRIDWLAERVE